ncbi:MAG: Rab family GTPase [Promethearchaeota archaeon]
MSTQEHHFRFKIAVVGDGGVGKTSLIKRYTKGSFESDYIKTIGAQFSKYDKEIEGDKIRLIFWDIAGQNELNFLRPSFFRDSNAVIIVYSLEENDLGLDSFNHISDWDEEIDQYCGEIPVVIFANKIDLIDDAHLDESKFQTLIEKHECLKFFKTSAKTGEGVIEAFNFIIENLYHKFKELSLSL